MLNIALPKGRLADKTCALLRQLNYIDDAVSLDERKLVFEDCAKGVRYFLVKPSDVAIYVEYGAADVGVVGKDILLESAPGVYELMDLNMGKCRMCVCAMQDFSDDRSRPLRVATKFVNITRDYYERTNRPIEIIKLNGSIELAPVLGMTDVIVDLVETGKTLKDNNLKIVEEIIPISARLIANKASYNFKNEEILNLRDKLQGVIEK